MYQLKCKAIALASEAQAFKQQEQRELRKLHKWKARAALGRLKAEKLAADPKAAFSVTQRGIHLHRTFAIRKEARNALLAYGFLRGLSYREMENFSWSQPNWDRIEKLALRYGNLNEQDIKQSFAQWRDEALNGVQPKWSETLHPGSVRNCVRYDPDWVHMQAVRNAIM